MGNDRVFPTGVGMDLRWRRCRGARASVPHRRGDGPPPPWRHRAATMCSPQAWGWTVGDADVEERVFVFPTGVGMDRGCGRFPATPACVPHRRGDGPLISDQTTAKMECSPQAWGWTVGRAHRHWPHGVFPTGVGMDRSSATSPRRPARVPHRRGDGPCYADRERSLRPCSPQAWGWTDDPLHGRSWRRVFPTCVGMDR